MSYEEENVLVIKRSLFDQLGAFQGLNFEPRKYIEAILSRGSNFFLRRADAEDDPTHKQIIPYVLLTYEDRVLFYVRGKKAGEKRLIAKGSIGIGGHMGEDRDKFLWHSTDKETYLAGVEREVAEEIKIETKFDDRVVALLNDDSNDVGRVHLGIVHLFRLTEPKVKKNEPMITELAFLSRDELLSRRDSLETWSQICLDSLDRLLA